jgi:hypothetical protein
MNRHVVTGLAALMMMAGPALAQDSFVTSKSLTPEVALDLARAALAECRRRGFQVAVAVVDRSGNVQVILRASPARIRRAPPRARRGPRRRSAPTPPSSMPSVSRE